MTKLLVSVRSAAEAAAALAGGAALIDVKEPGHGSLGCAGPETIAAVLRVIAGRRPVSAALGELTDCFSFPSGAWERRSRSSASRLAPDGKQSFPTSRSQAELGNARLDSLAFAKWGLADCRHRPDWPEELCRAAEVLPEGCRPVAVAYADWQRAAAPPPAAVCAFACTRSWGAFLIDTWRKDATTLLDWLTWDELSGLRDRCRQANVPVALAGSLGVEQVRRLLPLRPDWFAVRGAACRDGRRTATIDAGRVRRLVDLLGESLTAAIPAS